MDLSQNHIQALIASTPATPENQLLLAALESLHYDAGFDNQDYIYSNILAVPGRASALPFGTTSAPVITQIGADHHFLWIASTGFANTANAAMIVALLAYPNISMQIYNQSTGKQLFDAPMPCVDMVGNGEQVYYLKLPLLLPPTTKLAVTYTNFDAAVSYNVYLAFHGYKIFDLNS